MEFQSTLAGSFVVFIIGALAVVVLWCVRRRKRPLLPPFSSASMIDNMTASNKHKTLFQHERNRRLFFEIGAKDFGGTPFGSVFQSRVPVFKPFIMVSDYALARKVLTGEPTKGIPEGEKAAFAGSMNFLDRKECNILTHLTMNQDRERARKNIAQSFSTSNLMKTWPHIKGVIDEQFAEMRIAAQSGSIVDMKTSVFHFFMRSLSRGAFGIEFTTNGTETDDNINGLEYLEAVDIAARESALEMVIPFRPYMFWADGVVRNKAAVKTLRRIMEKVMRLYRAKQAHLLVTGMQNKPFSILDHVAEHAYSKEISRLSDLSILTFAGVDSTTNTFSFLLMELCKNPAVKAKLQDELATFMPARGTPASPTSEKELLSTIANCEYLTWCIKEVLRLWPVLARGNSRDLVHDIEYNGMLLPKGSMVVLNLFVMFRERWINQPDVYLPERWSDSNPQLPQLKEMLMPFSLGKRACIGQNMAMFQLRIVAAHFLHYFDFELAADVTFEHFITLKPEQLQMRVFERCD